MLLFLTTNMAAVTSPTNQQYEDVGEISILNLNKHIEQKTLFLVFVQSAVSRKVSKLFSCDGSEVLISLY